MTPEEYIEKLKDAQRTLDNVKDDLDRAILKMEQRLETGYEYLETVSRQAAIAGHERLVHTSTDIFIASFADIEY